MKKYIAVVMVLAVGLFAAPAYGATYFCTGPVTAVALSPNGVVTVSGFGGISWSYLCSVTAGQTFSNGYTSDACKAAYTTLITARLSGVPLTIGFNDNFSCTTQPSWANLTGLYWGPVY